MFLMMTILRGVDEMWGDKRFEERGRGAKLSIAGRWVVGEDAMRAYN